MGGWGMFWAGPEATTESFKAPPTSRSKRTGRGRPGNTLMCAYMLTEIHSEHSYMITTVDVHTTLHRDMCNDVRVPD